MKAQQSVKLRQLLNNIKDRRNLQDAMIKRNEIVILKGRKYYIKRHPIKFK